MKTNTGKGQQGNRGQHEQASSPLRKMGKFWPVVKFDTDFKILDLRLGKFGPAECLIGATLGGSHVALRDCRVGVLQAFKVWQEAMKAEGQKLADADKTLQNMRNGRETFAQSGMDVSIMDAAIAKQEKEIQVMKGNLSEAFVAEEHSLIAEIEKPAAAQCYRHQDGYLVVELLTPDVQIEGKLRLTMRAQEVDLPFEERINFNFLSDLGSQGHMIFALDNLQFHRVAVLAVTGMLDGAQIENDLELLLRTKNSKFGVVLKFLVRNDRLFIQDGAYLMAVPYENFVGAIEASKARKSEPVREVKPESKNGGDQLQVALAGAGITPDTVVPEVLVVEEATEVTPDDTAIEEPAQIEDDTANAVKGHRTIMVPEGQKPVSGRQAASGRTPRKKAVNGRKSGDDQD